MLGSEGWVRGEGDGIAPGVVSFITTSASHTPTQKHYHISVQIQDFTAVSKVLHNLAISLVLTLLDHAIHSNIYHDNRKSA